MSIQEVSSSHSLPTKFMVKDGYRLISPKPVTSTMLKKQEDKCVKNRRNRKRKKH